MPRSRLYEGLVRHRRFHPAAHEFAYKVFQVYLDLGELQTVFDPYLFWSVEKSNLASFRREDHLKSHPEKPLDQGIRDLVEERTGKRPDGPIGLLTHLRYFGYGFNPVSFYYCWDKAGENVETVVAEVSNTPWLQQHCYVLDEKLNEGTLDKKRYRFGKEFHVSPFFNLDMDYDWRFTAPKETLSVHMENQKDGKLLFDATMTLQAREMTGGNMARALLRYPLMTAQIVTAIHWQALRLWLKKVPVETHPEKQTPPKPHPLRKMGGKA